MLQGVNEQMAAQMGQLNNQYAEASNASMAEIQAIRLENSMLMEDIKKAREEAAAPKKIERDKSGRAISVGGKPIHRDGKGVMTQIG